MILETDCAIIHTSKIFIDYLRDSPANAEGIKNSLDHLRCVCLSTCAYANITYLLTVLADVRVDLIESAEHVELCGVESGLFCQIGVHVLVANGWQPVDVSVVPGDTAEGQHLASLTQTHSV